jgi:hypothetical protein
MGRESKTRTDETHFSLPRQFDSRSPISPRVRQALQPRSPPHLGKLETRKLGVLFVLVAHNLYLGNLTSEEESKVQKAALTFGSVAS